MTTATQRKKAEEAAKALADNISNSDDSPVDTSVEVATPTPLETIEPETESAASNVVEPAEIPIVKPALARPVPTSSYALAPFRETRHIIFPAKGVTMWQILQPEYWSHIARKLRPFDLVVVHPEDKSFWAELLVIDMTTIDAKVRVLRYETFGEETYVGDHGATVSRGGYLCEHAGSQIQWRIVRLSDMKTIKDGMTNQAAAESHLTAHLKAVNR